MNGLLERLKKPWRCLVDGQYREFRRAVRAYKKAKSRTVVTEFPNLTATSVAFDLGGYRGQWAREMSAKYGCQVHVFEAHPTFATALEARFADNQKTHIYPFALASQDGSFRLSNAEDASSAHHADADAIECQMVSVSRFLEETHVGAIDIMKINIEGGEYDVLPALMASGHIKSIGTLLIQFHNFAADDSARREAIRENLSQTHACDWCYPFVWEQWSRKPDPTI